MPSFQIQPKDTLVRTFLPSDVNPAQNRFQLSGHGLADGDEIRFVPAAGSLLPSPLEEDVHYFVVGASANDFQVATAAGGSPIDLTDSGAGESAIVEPSLTQGLVVEDGTGLANANSYISVAYADNYQAASLYNDAWQATSIEDKVAAVVSATRSIDANVDWYGYRSTTVQALDWPRIYVPDNRYPPSQWVRDPLAPLSVWGPTYPSNEIPKDLKDATAELAGEMTKLDRGAEWPALGISSVGLGQGALNVSFKEGAEQMRKAFTPLVIALLAPFGNQLGAAAGARVRRG